MYNPIPTTTADMPPTPIRRRWGFSVSAAQRQPPGTASAFGVFYQRRPNPNRRVERPAADDAVVNTPHWG